MKPPYCFDEAVSRVPGFVATIYDGYSLIYSPVLSAGVHTYAYKHTDGIPRATFLDRKGSENVLISQNVHTDLFRRHRNVSCYAYEKLK
jgi:hypothetical protein